MRNACRGTFETECLACAGQHAVSLTSAGCSNDDIRGECSTGHLMRVNVSVSAGKDPNKPIYLVDLHTYDDAHFYSPDQSSAAPKTIQSCVEYSPSAKDLWWFAGTGLASYTNGAIRLDQLVLQMQATPDMGPLGDSATLTLAGWTSKYGGGGSTSNISQCDMGCHAANSGRVDYSMKAGQTIAFQNIWSIEFHGFCEG